MPGGDLLIVPARRKENESNHLSTAEALCVGALRLPYLIICKTNIID